MKYNACHIKAALVVLALVVNPTGASAHTVLVGSNPVAGSVLKELPDSILLTFASPLLSLPGKSVNTITVIDPMNMQIASAPNLLGNSLRATLNEGMKKNGDFHVRYRVVAQDGHVLNGSYSFKVSSSDSAKPSSIKLITSGVRKYFSQADGNNRFLKGDKVGEASAEFSIDFSKNLLCYQVKVKNLLNITGAHIHALLSNNHVESVEDEVFIGLNPAIVQAGKRACLSAPNLMLSAVGDNPNHYFLMLHTQKYSDGAIGGVLKSH